MTSNFFTRAGATTVLSIAALLLMVGQSYGQQNSMVFPWQAQAYRQGGNGDPRAFRGSFSLPSAPAVSPSANVENTRAFYAGSSDADKVLIDVTVPADAKITLQGAKTTQTGSVRRFVSPPIAAGYQYAYNIQATWMEHGREVSQSRSFTVRPGDVVHVTFTHDTVTVRSEN
jgi:uncharacterized protein (TIGR03000 family)